MVAIQHNYLHMKMRKRKKDKKEKEKKKIERKWNQRVEK